MTWKALLFLLASFGAFNLGAMFIGLGRSEAKAAEIGQVQAIKIERVEAQVQFNKQAADAGLSEARKDIQAVYQFLLTKRRQPRLETAKERP